MIDKTDNNEVKKEINIYFDETGEDLQKIVDNLLLEIYKNKFYKINCAKEAFGV